MGDLALIVFNDFINSVSLHIVISLCSFTDNKLLVEGKNNLVAETNNLENNQLTVKV